MVIEIKVPILPESVTDAVVAKWYKKEGDFITRDENLVDLETDKVMLEVPAPKNGVIEAIKVKEGDVVKANQLLALLKEGDLKITKAKSSEGQEVSDKKEDLDERKKSSLKEEGLSPAVRRLIAENEIDISGIKGSGKDNRITKEDVQKYIDTQKEKSSVSQSDQEKNSLNSSNFGERTEKRVPLSRIRQRIAERLVQVQHEAAILTTFNEINMKPVMDLRKKYGEQFLKEFNVKLGFMSFFTKAAIEALKKYPQVNASIDGNDIIYHNYYDIGIAIGSDRGLVVPVLRNAEKMRMAEIEKQISAFASQAKDGRVSMEDLKGGTFTITNGGTYGSLLSTPIINPPQTAILGMHKIMERPVVEEGAIVIRPVMMVALSYDHRVIDGSDAVRFLVTIKDILEDPARFVLGF